MTTGERPATPIFSPLAHPERIRLIDTRMRTIGAARGTRATIASLAPPTRRTWLAVGLLYGGMLAGFLAVLAAVGEALR